MYQREHEGEVDCGDQPVGAGSSVAAVVPIHVARSLATEAVKEAQDVADEDQENKAGHAKANVVPEKYKKIVTGAHLGSITLDFEQVPSIQTWSLLWSQTSKI